MVLITQETLDSTPFHNSTPVANIDQSVVLGLCYHECCYAVIKCQVKLFRGEAAVLHLFSTEPSLTLEFRISVLVLRPSVSRSEGSL